MLTISVLSLGVLGVALRFLADTFVRSQSFPTSTFLVNVSGCFLAGWLMTTTIVSPSNKAPMLIGLCGGFTTFSSFILQSLQMIREGDWVKAIVYLLVSQLSGLLFAWAGMKAGEY